MHVKPLISLAIVASFAVGCQSDPPGPPQSTAPSDNRQAQVQDASPAAYIDSQVVTRDQLYSLMVEAEGGQALSELLLSRAIDQRLAEQGIALSDADLAAERALLLTSLSDNADQATRLLKTMREQRGLGEERFESLLRRSAGLRRLVRDGVTVNDASIKQAYDVRYGRQYRVRLITAGEVQTLTLARQRVLDGQAFADVAVQVSTDISVSQGGLLSPISAADATYPKALRDALPKLSVEDRAARLSPVIALPEGYALIWLEEVIDKDVPPLEQVRDELARVVRLELERVRMQQLARVMISQANVVVLDPALDKAWQRRRETIAQP